MEWISVPRPVATWTRGVEEDQSTAPLSTYRQGSRIGKGGWLATAPVAVHHSLTVLLHRETSSFCFQIIIAHFVPEFTDGCHHNSPQSRAGALVTRCRKSRKREHTSYHNLWGFGDHGDRERSRLFACRMYARLSLQRHHVLVGQYGDISDLQPAACFWTVGSRRATVMTSVKIVAMIPTYKSHLCILRHRVL